MRRELPMPNPVIAGPCRCGSRSVMRKHQVMYRGTHFTVECSRAECEEPSAWGETGAEAAEFWNRRQEADGTEDLDDT